MIHVSQRRCFGFALSWKSPLNGWIGTVFFRNNSIDSSINQIYCSFPYYIIIINKNRNDYPFWHSSSLIYIIYGVTICSKLVDVSIKVLLFHGFFSSHLIFMVVVGLGSVQRQIQGRLGQTGPSNMEDETPLCPEQKQWLRWTGGAKPVRHIRSLQGLQDNTRRSKER